VVFIALLLIVEYAAEKIKDCGNDVHNYIFICMIYFGQCAFRQLVIVLLISFTKNPQKTSDFANLLFIAFDSLFVSSLTIWGTMIQFEDRASECRRTSDKWVLLMYVMSICCLLYGWIYVILLCCGLTSLPLIAIFWCYYR